jgi:hypothetical protein
MNVYKTEKLIVFSGCSVVESTTLPITLILECFRLGNVIVSINFNYQSPNYLSLLLENKNFFVKLD